MMNRYCRIIGFTLALCMVLSVGVFPIMQSAKAVEKVYKISILSDISLFSSENSAPCDLTALSSLYTQAGHNVSFIDRTILTDADQFSTRVCDILVIPTGENFPVEAIPNFKKFIADGGRVITLGGYAFSHLLDEKGNTVEPYLGDVSLMDVDQLLGSNAPLYAQDQLRFDPTQIPIFDEEHYFDSAVTIRPAEDQAVFEGELKLSANAAIEGYSAITTTGNYRGRWQPLIYAYDTVGTRVGTVGAIFHIYSQPSNEGAHFMFPTWDAYKGTSIAFFGVTTHDLVAEGNQNLRDGFLKLADVLMEDTYIASIENKYDNYKQGETPEFDIYVENGSTSAVSGIVELDIIAEDSGDVITTVSAAYSVDPKSRQTVHAVWSQSSFDDDFYQVNARVISADGTVIDRYQTGFSVWDDAVIAQGPKYIYEDNYIKLQQADGTYKTIFATGVDDGGNLLINEDQTPLVWKQEFIRRQDTGMYIYECLQQYRTAGDFAHLFASAESLEKHYRSVDNIVYLSQKYGQIYMMGIAIGDDVSANGDNLEKIADDVAYLAQRYQSVPGLIYYLNGDLICRVSNDKNKQDFNEFLTLRYGNSNNLNKAWGTFGLELGDVDLDAEYTYNGDGWADVKAYDINLFKTTLITRWTSRLLAAIRQNDPTEKAVLCEFYSWPAESVDIPLALGDMTYSNIGFFQTRQEFVQSLAYSDQRYQGKGFGIGETGRRTHPSFSASELIYQSASYDESRAFFYTGLISTYAMGGNHYQQWCWNDESKYVFPWGMNYTGDKAPRDLYYWFRNTNFVLKQTDPVYETPEVAIILPDSTRASGNQIWFGGHYGSIYAIDILQNTNAGSVLTLNESNLIIDPGIKVIYYPMAYTMPQNVYETLKAWVEQGGTLYLSGDFTYDSLLRTRDYENRLEELAGVKTITVNYSGLDSAAAGAGDYSDGANNRLGKPCLDIELAGAKALYQDFVGNPIITQYQLGLGNVIYSCDPLEYNASATMFDMNVTLYSQILTIAGVKHDWINAEQGSVKFFRQAQNDGGYFYELLNINAETAIGTLTTNYHTYNFSVNGGNADYILESSGGKVTAVLHEGDLYRGGVKLVRNEPYAHVMTMDEMDVTMSRRIVVMPQQTGKFSLYSQIDLQDMTVRIGQVENGCWVDMGQVQFVRKDGYITFDVLPDMVNAIIIIGVKGFVESLGVDGFGYMVADALVTGGVRGAITAEQNGGYTKLYGVALGNDMIQTPENNDNTVVLPPQEIPDPQNAFVWVFMGICAVVVTSIIVGTEIIKKKLKK